MLTCSCRSATEGLSWRPDFAAVRRLGVCVLRRRDLTAALPALERRLIAFPRLRSTHRIGLTCTLEVARWVQGLAVGRDPLMFVSNGSPTLEPNVRGWSAYPPILSVIADIGTQPGSATSGREQTQHSTVRRRQTYSITSSARMSRIVGISRPSVLAVRKLITRSNLVGCTTGSSPAFSPFRMRPT